eukprot:2353449-Alexandrium_andersonii.AAC.1
MFHHPGRSGRRDVMAPARLFSREWCRDPSSEYSRCCEWYWKVEAWKKGPGGPLDRTIGASVPARGAHPASQGGSR